MEEREKISLPADVEQKMTRNGGGLRIKNDDEYI
jgi:hypothetical protein